MNNKYNIIIDTDPGIDDCIALCAVDYYSGKRFKAAVSTYGNMPQFRTTNNLLTMLQYLNRPDVYAIKGSKENEGRYDSASYIHGVDGMGGAGKDFPEFDTMPSNFADEVYYKIKEFAPVDYIALGPLTNIAEIIKQHPDVCDFIHAFYVMGGGFDMGNVTPFAEFNIYTDPASANYFFANATAPIYLAPLNTTSTIYYDFAEIDEYKASGRFDDFCSHILTEEIKSSKIYGEPGAIMHDATATIIMTNPELFEYKNCGVRVICDEGERFGETIMTEGNNVYVALKADSRKVLELITKALSKK